MLHVNISEQTHDILVGVKMGVYDASLLDRREIYCGLAYELIHQALVVLASVVRLLITFLLQDEEYDAGAVFCPLPPRRSIGRG